MKNKIFICLFSLCVVFNIINFLYAYTTNSTLPEDIPSFDKFYDYYDNLVEDVNLDNGYVLYKKNNVYCLNILSDSNQKFVVSDFNSSDVSVCQQVSMFAFNYDPTNNKEKVWKSGFSKDDLPVSGKFRIGGNTSDYWTNCGIYYENGELVFPIPVLTLGEVLEKNNPVKNFQTMMSGIIPYLLAFMIGLVAFWKGWQFLSKALHKA